MRGATSIANCFLQFINERDSVTRSMEVRVQVLSSGVVVMGWGFPWCGGGSIRCGSNKVWLEKVGAEQVHPSY